MGISRILSRSRILFLALLLVLPAACSVEQPVKETKKPVLAACPTSGDPGLALAWLERWVGERSPGIPPAQLGEPALLLLDLGGPRGRLLAKRLLTDNVRGAVSAAEEGVELDGATWSVGRPGAERLALVRALYALSATGVATWPQALAARALEGSSPAPDGDRALVLVAACELSGAAADRERMSGVLDQLAQAAEVSPAGLEALARGYQLLGKSAWLTAAVAKAAAQPDASLHSTAAAGQAIALRRLSLLAGKPELGERAKKILEAFAGWQTEDPVLVALWARAKVYTDTEPLDVLIIGDKQNAEMAQFAEEARRFVYPWKVVLQLDCKADAAMIEAFGYPPEPDPTVYVCIAEACSMPIDLPKDLRGAIDSFIGGHPKALALAREGISPAKSADPEP